MAEESEDLAPPPIHALKAFRERIDPHHFPDRGMDPDAVHAILKTA